MKKRLLMVYAAAVCVMAASGTAWCGNNGNGTVTVNGLVWLEDAGCLGASTWYTAMAQTQSLADGQCKLTDKSKPGDWRLPTIEELKSIYSAKSQFKNVHPYYYWSSITFRYATTDACAVSMSDASWSWGMKTLNDVYVWPVRAGQK